MKSQKIGIINFHYSNVNYGAVLQAYALQSYLRDLGYEAVTINFLNFPRWPQLIIKNFISAFSNTPFERFRKQWLQPMTRHRIFWANQLSRITFDFDTYIAGGDQIWRASGKTILPSHTAYYLSFVPDGRKRLSYAASFGIDKWEGKEKYTDTVKQELARFNAIGIREQSGVEIVKNVFCMDSVQVLDSVLLAGRSYFDKIIGDNNQVINDRIVYYKLDVDDEFNTLIQYLVKEMKTEPKNIYYLDRMGIINKNKRKFYEVDNWLREIRDAKLVITDSYHAVCFCILFEKQFICYKNEQRGITRLESLLGILGLVDRIYSSPHEVKENKKWKQLIDYTKVRIVLDVERNKSMSFLRKALNN